MNVLLENAPILDEAPIVGKKPGRQPDPESKRSQGEDRHILPRIAFHLPAYLNDAIRALARRNRRDLTKELILAIEAHLRAAGVTLDPPDESEES